MKIVGVVDEDPFDQKTWSGSSYYFFEALKTHGFLHSAISARPLKVKEYFYKLISMQPNINAWRFKYHLNTGFYRQMSKEAHKELALIPTEEYNVILQIGAWYNMTDLKDKLVVSYHDGNLATLIKSPYGYPSIKEEYIKRALDYEKKLYKRINLIFPMSQWLADSFIKDNGVKADKLIPVGGGINLPKIREIKEKSYDAPHILFIGKDFKRKGGKSLLEAFSIVRSQIRDAELTIIGPHIKVLPDGVRCIGPLSKSNPKELEQLLDEYGRASIFVMPSLYEPFGIVFAEAMAHRLPCVGTNICAMPEIIDHGQTGYLVSPGDSNQLAQRLIDLLKDPTMCRQFGEYGFEKYRKQFNWPVVTLRICDEIQSRL